MPYLYRQVHEVEQFFTLSFVQSHEKIIVSSAACNIHLSFIHFKLTQKDMEELLTLIPANASLLFQPNVKPIRKLNIRGSFNKVSASQVANMSQVLQSRNEILSDHSRHNSFVRDGNLSKNLSGESSCKCYSLTHRFL